MKTAYKRKNVQSLIQCHVLTNTTTAHIFKDTGPLAEVLHCGTHVSHLQKTLVSTPAIVKHIIQVQPGKLAPPLLFTRLH